MKIKWKVSEVPTGMYRSFQQRAWPSAYYENGDPVAQILCADQYIPRDVTDGNHDPLTVLVADYSVTPWKWRKFKTHPATLAEAKAMVDRILVQYPHFRPKEVVDGVLSESQESAVLPVQGK